MSIEQDLLAILAIGYDVRIQATDWGGFTCRASKVVTAGHLVDREDGWTGFDKTLPKAVANAADGFRRAGLIK